MSAIVFVDTNVLVYARDAGEPRKQAMAAEWIHRLWVEQRGRTSAQVLSEYYATVTRKLRPGLTAEEAWDDVHALLAWEPLPVNGEVLARAHRLERRFRLSWWDSLIVAAAQIQNCELLLSEDLQHGLVCDTLRICNPFLHQVAEPAVAYSAAPERLTRHRPRGRPRRATTAAP
jgi:predicted nucleic acid-binding protein